MNKILVIEDEDLIREGIVLILTVNGYEVFEAENGRSGTAVALKEIPDLIISDIMMPEMNGFAVLKTVRANPETSTYWRFVSCNLCRCKEKHQVTLKYIQHQQNSD